MACAGTGGGVGWDSGVRRGRGCWRLGACDDIGSRLPHRGGRATARAAAALTTQEVPHDKQRAMESAG
jgi:hypothetical protein